MTLLADLSCNYIVSANRHPKKRSCTSLSCQGNQRWVTALDNIFHDDFANSTALPWITIESGAEAGWVRFAGGDGATAGNLTFVAVYEAG